MAAPKIVPPTRVEPPSDASFASLALQHRIEPQLAVKLLIAAVTPRVRAMATKLARRHRHISRADLEQEGFAAVIEAAPRYRPFRTLGPDEPPRQADQLLAVAAWRTMTAFVRNNRPWSPSDDVYEPADVGPSPDEQLEVSEDRRRVRAAVDSLPDDLRELVHLHLMGGVSLVEAARQLGISRQTARSRLERAQALLRKNLASGQPASLPTRK